jgi:hypothetical protein
LHEVSNIFGCLPREPSKGVGSGTTGYGKVNDSIVSTYTGWVGEYGTHSKEVGLSKEYGDGVDTSKVIGNGNGVDPYRDVV